MTINDAVAHLRVAIGPSWPHAKPVPPALVGDLCAALWEAGEHPQMRRIRASWRTSARSRIPHCET